MATVIDTLTLQLGLDPRQFVEGRREAEHALAQSRMSLDRFGQNVEAQGKKVGDVFGVMKAGAVGIVGAFVGGQAAGWIDNIMRMDNAAGNLSKTIGVGIPNLSMWQGLVKQVGGEASDASSALGGLRQSLNDMIQGGGMLPVGAASLLNRIGGWQGKDPEKIINELIDYFDKEIGSKRMSTSEAATFLRRLPGMTENMITLMLKGRDAINEMTRAQREAGTATEDSAAKAAEYVKQEALLIAQLHDLGRLTFPGVTDAVKTISESLRGLGGTLRENGTDWGKWSSTISSAFSAHIVPGGFIDRLKKFVGKEFTWRSLRELFGGGPGIPDEGGAPAPPPAAQTAPAATGGAPGATPYTIKHGAGGTSLLTDTLARKIHSEVGGVDRFTAFNDAYHAFLGGSHPAGRGLDFTISDPAKSAEAAAQVRAILKEMGLQGTVLDEYKRKSGNWTGGHIHVQVEPPSPAAARNLTGARDRPSGAPAAATMAPGNQTSNTRGGDTTQTSAVHIGTLNVNAPKATDANGIARDMEGAIRPLALATAFNSAQV